MDLAELVAAARSVASQFTTAGCISAGGVGAAIRSSSGAMYTGICIDAACGIGFCAEHAAVAEMLKHRESEIVAIVAVSDTGKVMPPCGRCRELLYQLSPTNLNTIVQVGETEQRSLRDLLPNVWDYA